MHNTLLLLKRLLAFAAVFALLGIYLFALQHAYEKPGLSVAWKVTLFAVIVLGSGFVWDASKYVSRMEEACLEAFLASLWKASFSLALYAALFFVVVQLLGPWAGPATVSVLLVAIVSFACACYGVEHLGRAVGYAVARNAT
jgi:hypothetical protein